MVPHAQAAASFGRLARLVISPSADFMYSMLFCRPAVHLLSLLPRPTSIGPWPTTCRGYFLLPLRLAGEAAATGRYCAAFNLVVCAGKALTVGRGNFWLGKVANGGTVTAG